MLLRGKREALRVETTDVSVHGLFLRTDEPPPLRQLVKVEVELPGSARRLLLHGMVVFSRKAGSGALPTGIGIQLVGLDGDVLSRWDDFVRSLAPRISLAGQRVSQPDIAALPHPPVPPRPPVPAAPARPARSLERRGGELRLVFAKPKDLTAFAARHVTEPEVFVATSLPLPAGLRLHVSVEHPDTYESYPLDATVRRRAREGDAFGVAVAFAPLDAKARAAFVAFAGDDAEELADEDIQIDSE